MQLGNIWKVIHCIGLYTVYDVPGECLGIYISAFHILNPKCMIEMLKTNPLVTNNIYRRRDWITDRCSFVAFGKISLEYLVPQYGVIYLVSVKW